jgi:hypothetical protein
VRPEVLGRRLLLKRTEHAATRTAQIGEYSAGVAGVLTWWRNPSTQASLDTYDFAHRLYDLAGRAPSGLGPLRLR